MNNHEEWLDKNRPPYSCENLFEYIRSVQLWQYIYKKVNSLNNTEMMDRNVKKHIENVNRELNHIDANYNLICMEGQSDY